MVKAALHLLTKCLRHRDQTTVSAARRSTDSLVLVSSIQADGGVHRHIRGI
jgi:hypothetical protein